MNMEEIRAAEARLLVSTYDRNPLLFVGGEGVHIIDEKGERYLDLLSGIGVNNPRLQPSRDCGSHCPSRATRSSTPRTFTSTRDRRNWRCD